MKAEKIQNKIYQKMPARKKMAILDMFYKTGKKLEKLKDERTNPNRNLNQNRQNS